VKFSTLLEVKHITDEKDEDEMQIQKETPHIFAEEAC
jgi:hypothetical protein